MPAINGLLETSLYVDDVQRSAEFYQSLFGFAPIVVSERLIAMAVKKGEVLLLFKKRESLKLPVGKHDGDGQLHLAFAVDASEVEPWRALLSERNIPIEEEINWERGGVSLYFRDPDGHLLELGSPGIWSNY
jgi:catechol 2,3-dioxygenase-like lactoylglutathione lyase family enzyme